MVEYARLRDRKPDLATAPLDTQRLDETTDDVFFAYLTLVRELAALRRDQYTHREGPPADESVKGVPQPFAAITTHGASGTVYGGSRTYNLPPTTATAHDLQPLLKEDRRKRARWRPKDSLHLKVASSSSASANRESPCPSRAVRALTPHGSGFGEQANLFVWN